MKSPRCESSSSPIGVSNDTGSCAIFKTSRTLSGVMCNSLPISSGKGSRPNSCKRLRCTRINLLIVSTMWTGIRIVRAWSAIARVIA